MNGTETRVWQCMHLANWNMAPDTLLGSARLVLYVIL